MSGLDLLGGRRVGHLLLVALAQRLFGDGLGHITLQVGIAQDLVFEAGDAPLDVLFVL